MAIETCKNCKRIIVELEQAYTWQKQVLCKECYARLSNYTLAEPTFVDSSPVITLPLKRNLVKSTLIVMATVIVVIFVIYIIYIGILAMVTVKEDSLIEQARVTTTKAYIRILYDAILQFKKDTGRYPEEDEGLNVLVDAPDDVENYPDGGYLENAEVPMDAWGEQFIYERYPESGKPFVIKSLGADRQEGGEGYNADIISISELTRTK